VDEPDLLGYFKDFYGDDASDWDNNVDVCFELLQDMHGRERVDRPLNVRRRRLERLLASAPAGCASAAARAAWAAACELKPPRRTCTALPCRSRRSSAPPTIHPMWRKGRGCRRLLSGDVARVV
jgi:hypothetical protein